MLMDVSYEPKTMQKDRFLSHGRAPNMVLCNSNNAASSPAELMDNAYSLGYILSSPIRRQQLRCCITQAAK